MAASAAYAAGVLYAVAAGACNSVGGLLQKRAVDRLEAEQQGQGFFRGLLRQPLWVTGLAVSMGLGTVFFLLAQLHIGPALIPGLMASGLVILVIGSVPITGERLHHGEILGVVLMIVGIALLGASRLDIDLRHYDVLARGFLRRAAAFSAALLLAALAARLAARRGPAPRGTPLALFSGFLYVLSNFWVGPFMGVTLSILGGAATTGAVLMFVFASAVLVLTNLFGIASLQRAFRSSKAVRALPLQNVPIQLAPPLVYLLVFGLAPPLPYSLPFLGLGVALVLACSFLLARRRAALEAGEERAPAEAEEDDEER